MRCESVRRVGISVGREQISQGGTHWLLMGPDILSNDLRDRRGWLVLHHGGRDAWRHEVLGLDELDLHQMLAHVRSSCPVVQEVQVVLVFRLPGPRDPIEFGVALGVAEVAQESVLDLLLQPWVDGAILGLLHDLIVDAVACLLEHVEGSGVKRSSLQQMDLLVVAVLDLLLRGAQRWEDGRELPGDFLQDWVRIRTAVEAFPLGEEQVVPLLGIVKGAVEEARISEILQVFKVGCFLDTRGEGSERHVLPEFQQGILNVAHGVLVGCGSHSFVELVELVLYVGQDVLLVLVFVVRIM